MLYVVSLSLCVLAASGSRSFDIRIVTKLDEVLMFSNIARDEFESIYDFLKNKGLDMASTYEGVTSIHYLYHPKWKLYVLMCMHLCVYIVFISHL